MYNKSRRNTISLSDKECPKCHGTGWILYETEDGTEEIYGQPMKVEYAKRCNCGNNVFINEDRTGFPEMYRGSSVDAFDWNIYGIDTTDFKTVAMSFYNDFDKWKEKGKGLYIWSKTAGSGKTFLSACLAKSIMFKKNSLVKYVTPLEYIDKVAQGYRDKNLHDPSQVYRECSLLVLDDLGTQKTDDWYEQELFRLIDERSSNGLATIITSNYKVEDLRMDERIKSRILRMSIVVHMPEISIRNQKAAEEQSDFIKEVLGG